MSYEGGISRAEWRNFVETVVLTFICFLGLMVFIGEGRLVPIAALATAAGMCGGWLVGGVLICFIPRGSLQTIVMFCVVCMSVLWEVLGGFGVLAVVGSIMGVTTSRHLGITARVWLQRRFPPTPKQLREDAEKLRLNPAMAEGAPLGGKPASGRHGVTRRQRAALWRRRR